MRNVHCSAAGHKKASTRSPLQLLAGCLWLVIGKNVISQTREPINLDADFPRLCSSPFAVLKYHSTAKQRQVDCILSRSGGMVIWPSIVALLYLLALNTWKSVHTSSACVVHILNRLAARCPSRLNQRTNKQRSDKIWRRRANCCRWSRR